MTRSSILFLFALALVFPACMRSHAKPAEVKTPPVKPGTPKPYKEVVTAEGLGASSFDVKQDGSAFGVAKQTVLTVYQLLRAVN